jgi:IclR family transcriptional regulator, acetate operon repressor
MTDTTTTASPATASPATASPATASRSTASPATASPATASRSTANPTGTQAVDRAARLLTEIVDSHEPVTFGELAETSGLAKSTTSRLLFALERHGLVRREPSGYRPGPVFIRYSYKAGRQVDLVEIAQPFLQRIGEQTGETVNLGVASRGLVEQIAQVDSRYVLGGTNWVGRAVPLHCTAQGKVLLAFGAAQLPEGRLERMTDRTITNRMVLGHELEEIRRRNFAVTDEELEPGLVAIASPVYREGGSVVAALSVSGPSTRLSARRWGEVAAACIAEGNALSELLGHNPRREGAA